MEAHCFKCKAKREMVPPMEEKKMKNGAIQVCGKCKVCGGKICTFKPAKKD